MLSHFPNHRPWSEGGNKWSGEHKYRATFCQCLFTPLCMTDMGTGSFLGTKYNKADIKVSQMSAHMKASEVLAPNQPTTIFAPYAAPEWRTLPPRVGIASKGCSHLPLFTDAFLRLSAMLPAWTWAFSLGVIRPPWCFG